MIIHLAGKLQNIVISKRYFYVTLQLLLAK